MTSRMVQLKAGGHISQCEEEIVDMEIKTMQVTRPSLYEVALV